MTTSPPSAQITIHQPFSGEYASRVPSPLIVKCPPSNTWNNPLPASSVLAVNVLLFKSTSTLFVIMISVSKSISANNFALCPEANTFLKSASLETSTSFSATSSDTMCPHSHVPTYFNVPLSLIYAYACECASTFSFAPHEHSFQWLSLSNFTLSNEQTCCNSSVYSSLHTEQIAPCSNVAGCPSICAPTESLVPHPLAHSFQCSSLFDDHSTSKLCPLASTTS